MAVQKHKTQEGMVASKRHLAESGIMENSQTPPNVLWSLLFDVGQQFEARLIPRPVLSSPAAAQRQGGWNPWTLKHARGMASYHFPSPGSARVALRIQDPRYYQPLVAVGPTSGRYAEWGYFMHATPPPFSGTPKYRSRFRHHQGWALIDNHRGLVLQLPSPCQDHFGAAGLAHLMSQTACLRRIDDQYRVHLAHSHARDRWLQRLPNALNRSSADRGCGCDLLVVRIANFNTAHHAMRRPGEVNDATTQYA
ncbi:hypothetical protein B0T16DRAFT_394565 [Cercophora newfieldiana]|uniref:Uncharacterized protein n=1 Tax=Cercophora newfieldiana TaxID=92897 RepID=A0AA40CIR9_9PEZI|nr:hypothetical protein B0T16DRAFT_394565 [Cercophora newfieldiana]